MDTIEKFKKYVALPSFDFYNIEIEKAEGVYLYSTDSKKYIDMCSGVGVTNAGHNNPYIINAIRRQLDKYLHILVYGEIVLKPQAEFAELLIKNLPKGLDKVFFVNSGSEAIEGAIKAAKRFTGKYEIIAFENSYHGSTHGAFSLMNKRELTKFYRPLLPGIKFIKFGDVKQLYNINAKTCCVVAEPIQAEAGVIVPDKFYFKELKEKCKKNNCLLILDEVQTGMGRTGKLFAFEHFDIVPDILVLAKALGGGLPLGAFIMSEKIAEGLKKPPLGHITTYGGNPLSVTAGKATLEFLLKTKIFETAENKANKILEKIKKHPKIKKITGKGMLYAVYLEDEKTARKFIDIALNKTYLITDIFLFRPNAFRIAPPLTINNNEINDLTNRILETLDNL